MDPFYYSFENYNTGEEGKTGGMQSLYGRLLFRTIERENNRTIEQ